GELLQRRGLLRAGDEEALHHEAGDPALAVGDAVGDLAHDARLAHVVLARVAVARVDDQAVGRRAAQAGGAGDPQRRRDVVPAVVGAGAAAAQDDVAVGVARGLDGGGTALAVGPEERVLARGGDAAVD